MPPGGIHGNPAGGATCHSLNHRRRAWAKGNAAGLVLAAEAINSAVERIVDIVSPQWHPLARDAKDLAASGVLIAAIGAATVGIIVFLPYL